MGSLACGAGLGGATITVTVILVQSLQRHLDVASYQEAAPDPLLAGLFAGIAVAAAFGWRRSRALDNLWQRGVIAVLSAVGALIAGFLAAPIHQLLGLAGLLAWALAGIALGVAGSVWALRGTGEAGRGVGTP